LTIEFGNLEAIDGELWGVKVENPTEINGQKRR
jgi:hypothetical protein